MPAYMLTDQVSTDVLRRECDVLRWPWFDDGDYDLNFFGIRGVATASNLFDDLIGCGLKVDGKPQVHLWRATTDPGRPYLLRPMRPQGCAILCDGFHPGLWELGEHRGQYPALTQAAPAPFWRVKLDTATGKLLVNDAPFAFTGPPSETGIIGCNQHKAASVTRHVDNWSACCQVHQRTSGFEAAMGLARAQVENRGWKSFSYKLFSVRKSPRLDALLAAVPE